MNLLRRQLAFVAILSAVAAADTRAQLPDSLVEFRKPTFPVAMKSESVVDGFATVAFLVRADGRVDDAVVLEATHPEFGEAVLEVLPEWRFAALQADALPRREVLRCTFKQNGAIASVSHLDAAKAAFPPSQFERLPIRTVTWAQLTAPPERTTTRTPAIKASQGGKVAISYVIDTEGHVRVPAIVEATSPDLGLAALEAVKQWQFAPPTYEGLPVLVEDTRSFTFGK